MGDRDRDDYYRDRGDDRRDDGGRGGRSMQRDRKVGGSGRQCARMDAPRRCRRARALQTIIHAGCAIPHRAAVQISLLVKNIAHDTPELDLRRLFEKYGEIRDVVRPGQPDGGAGVGVNAWGLVIGGRRRWACPRCAAGRAT